MQQSPVLSVSPSLSNYSSSRFADIVSKVADIPVAENTENSCSESENPSFAGNAASHSEPPPNGGEAPEVGNGGDEDDDFEFAVVGRDFNDSPISADEIFFNGQIRPTFPVFNRDVLSLESASEKPENESRSIRLPLGKLMIEDREPPSSSSSEADELEGIPDGTYCVWRPRAPGTAASETPSYRKKSNSTGSSKRWRLRNLLHRSNSDGKDTFVFLAAPPAKKSAAAAAEKTAGPSKAIKDSSGNKAGGVIKRQGSSGEKEISGPEKHYIRSRALKEGDRRKSFLPYRQDLESAPLLNYCYRDLDISSLSEYDNFGTFLRAYWCGRPQKIRFLLLTGITDALLGPNFSDRPSKFHHAWDKQVQTVGVLRPLDGQNCVSFILYTGPPEEDPWRAWATRKKSVYKNTSRRHPHLHLWISKPISCLVRIMYDGVSTAVVDANRRITRMRGYTFTVVFPSQLALRQTFELYLWLSPPSAESAELFEII
ncbi:hypothetical protein ACLOJK_032483 [Asimina triloba]